MQPLQLSLNKCACSRLWCLLCSCVNEIFPPQVLIIHTNNLTSLVPKSCSLLSLITVKVIVTLNC